MGKCVDFDKVAAGSKLDVKFLYDLAQDFYAANKDIIPSIKESMSSKDYQSVSFYLHSIKNGADIIGAYKLSHLSSELEHCMSKNNVTDDSISKLEFLYELLEQVCQECLAVKELV